MKLHKKIFGITLFLSLPFVVMPALVLHAADKPETKSVKIGVVNFTTCVEKSKLGQQEQATFELMKSQMEKILKEKEKVLTEIAEQLEDPDFVDGLSVEKETELKRNYRTLGQELAQLQNQYIQTLQQANVQIIQKIADIIAKASERVAEQKKFDLLVNKDSTFFHAADLDVSDLVAKEMDTLFDQEKAASPAPTPAGVPPVAGSDKTTTPAAPVK